MTNRRSKTPSRGYASIGLVRPKNVYNLGSVLRAGGCYGVDYVAIETPRMRHSDIKNIATDTTKAWRHIPTIQGEDIIAMMPIGAVGVAVDLVEGATDLRDFEHPENAYYIFGPEDGTLGAKITGRCQYKVMIPTLHCMNLAATVNVVLYDRLCKRRGT